MFKRLLAIAAIFICTSIAWAVLGSTIFYRTYSLDPVLRSHVSSTWGTDQQQDAPTATYTVASLRQNTSVEDGKVVTRTVEATELHPLDLDQTRARVDLHLDYRRKGLLWYSTYQVHFGGTYRFTNSGDQSRRVTFNLHLPAEQAIYDDMAFTIDGKPAQIVNAKGDAYAVAEVAAHQSVLFGVEYRSQGLGSWQYSFGNSVNQVRDFELRMATDFGGFDFPDGTLSPSEERATMGGWDLIWKYKNLVSGYQVGLKMPEKLQPGPLTGRISYFAPVSLLFFFFVLFMLTTIRGIELHPVNYFFLACAFFSFHLLMAYLVDQISIHLAFAICSCVSVFLVVSYLRLVVGMRFAAVEAGLAQFVYLILFSYAFFFEGFTGLAITIGAIVSLFIAMQLTGRIRWTEKWSGVARSAPGLPS
jgi:inner membrane protein involved in colicin E2 resistance